MFSIKRKVSVNIVDDMLGTKWNTKTKIIGDKNRGSRSEKQDHSQHKSYQEQKKQYEESKRKEHKQKTGRLFQEWAKFDLENPANNKAHEVLGTSLNSTPSEIKKAYYALAKKWMPDTLKHWAKTTEEMEEGLKIAQMINIAYEKIGKGR